jgi:hypothetical protein
MKVQEHAIAAEKHISILELMFSMLVVNIDSLKRNVSVGNWFEIHEMEKNDFTKAYLDQTLAQGSKGDCRLCL